MSKNSLENNKKKESVSAITQQKADDFDYLMNLIKKKNKHFFTVRQTSNANTCTKNMGNEKSL